MFVVPYRHVLTLAPGTVLDGRYEIVAPLGSGGMGQVYRARRSMLGDEVAVKIMSASFDVPSEARQRFLRESQACAQLHHPNIVTILDFNVDANGQPYLVMELLSGPSLRDELELGGPMAIDDAVSILSAVASALQVAHDRGITHRDLKPPNIISHRYESGQRVYKIIDFGLAAVEQVTGMARLTAPNVFMGTMTYAAPEQLNGESGEARTDIFSLGVIAYEMLTGCLPFDARDRLALVNQILTAAPIAPRMHRQDLPAQLDAVILKALAKTPAERWPKVADFAEALRDAAGVASGPSNLALQNTPMARYELGELLGAGRLGSLVYRGSHRALGVPVAIRVLRRDNQPNWDAVRARFLIEARTLQVSHPNLLHVRDYGEDDRLVFVVTDYIEGPSLRTELAAAGTFPWPRVTAILRQMLDATAALNAHGGFIVGINPDMVRLARDGDVDRVLLSAAGIVSVQDVLATMKEQELRGSEANERELPYLPPEVLLGSGPDRAADVFTAGVLAYQMATETLPFRAPSLPALIGQMLHTLPAPPRSLNRDVPMSASDAILRALDPDPAARPADASTFARELSK